MKVLSIGETVMEVNDSGFSGTVETLRIQLLVDDSMLQVWSNPFVHTCYAVAVICDPLCDIIVPVDLKDFVHICCPIRRVQLRLMVAVHFYRCTLRVCGIFGLTEESTNGVLQAGRPSRQPQAMRDRCATPTGMPLDGLYFALLA